MIMMILPYERERNILQYKMKNIVSLKNSKDKMKTAILGILMT